MSLLFGIHYSTSEIQVKLRCELTGRRRPSVLPNLPGSIGLYYCRSVFVSTSYFAEILELGDHVSYHHLHSISHPLKLTQLIQS